jgi:hypothetical protein
MTNTELMDTLRARQTEAWAESGRMATMADAGQVEPSVFYAALEKAQRASAMLNAMLEADTGRADGSED